MRIVVVGGTVLVGTELIEKNDEALLAADLLPEDSTVTLAIKKPKAPSAESATPETTAQEPFRMAAFYRTALAAQAGWI